MVTKMTLRSSYDDLDISVIDVRPDGEVKAVIQISHGMCGCKERFLPFMEYMAQRGVACLAGDHRGHGGSVKSKDDLGYMYDGGYQALVADMRMITTWIHREYPALPIYLLGHSMGSLAARVYAKDDDSEIDGLILCGSPSWNPMARLGVLLTSVMCMIGMSRRHMVRSQRTTSDRYNRSFASEGYQAWTCSDPEVRKSLMENPLCNFAMTANGSCNLMKMMVATYDKVPWMVSNPELPVVFLSGADDPMMLDERRFHKSAQHLCDKGYHNVSSALYPNMRHEILNEIGKEQVWDDVLDFMDLE